MCVRTFKNKFAAIIAVSLLTAALAVPEAKADLISQGGLDYSSANPLTNVFGTIEGTGSIKISLTDGDIANFSSLVVNTVGGRGSVDQINIEGLNSTGAVLSSENFAPGGTADLTALFGNDAALLLTTINISGAPVSDATFFGNQVIFSDTGVPATSGGTTNVPEPGTLALFGAGLAGLVYFRRRAVSGDARLGERLRSQPISA